MDDDQNSDATTNTESAACQAFQRQYINTNKAAISVNLMTINIYDEIPAEQ